MATTPSIKDGVNPEVPSEMASMAEAIVQLKHHDEARALFGPRDENLRKLCGATGTQIVLRGNQIRIVGTETEVTRCRQALQRWQKLLSRQESLQPVMLLLI